MGALSTAYAIAVLLVAVGGVALVLSITPRTPDVEGEYSSALTTLAVAVFMVALVWTIAF